MKGERRELTPQMKKRRRKKNNIETCCREKKKEYYRFYIYFTITNRIYSFYGVSINIFISN